MVRNVLYVLVAVLFICGCKEQNKSERVVQQRHVDNLVCDNTHFNFGDVSKKNKSFVDFSFVIMNMGDSLAKISSVEESCSCIHVEKFTRKIPPKQKGTIKGVVDIKKQKGHFSKPIFVNCSGDKVLLLRIIGDIS